MKKRITFEIKIPTENGYKSIKDVNDEEFELYRRKIAERVGKVLSRRSK